jgi:hypothetical protein
MSQEDFILINRAFVLYLLTDEGKQTMMHLLGQASKVDLIKALGLEVEQGTYENQYYPDGYLGMEEKRLNHVDLFEVSGWIYNNRVKGTSTVHPPDAVDVVKIPNLVQCDECHVSTPRQYCGTVVKSFTGGREQTQTLCNHCRMHSNDMRVRSDSSGKTCMDCRFVQCQYHPRRAQTQSTILQKAEVAARQIEFQPSSPMGGVSEPVNFSAI